MSESSNEFGGFASGHAAGSSRRTGDATDRLEREVNKFADSLSRLTARISGSGGGSGGGPGYNSGNGGNVSFGGAPAHRYEGTHSAGASPPPATPAAVADAGGAHRAGAHRGPGFIAQNGGGFARGAAVVAGGGLAVYTKNHFDGQTTGQTVATQIAGGNWSQAYRQGMTGNYTAHGDQDHWATMSMMVNRAGGGTGSAAWQNMSMQTRSYSAVNAAITNQQGATAITSLGSTGSINRLNALGISPLNSSGNADPRALARQILSRMGSARVKTREQVDAAFGPNGSAVVTLDNYAAAGALPAGAREVVESEMRRILYAQVKGIDYKHYDMLANAANNNDSGGLYSRKILSDAGIGTQSLSQDQYRKQGKSRDSEAETIGGFTKSVKGATETLGFFRDALNKVMHVIPGAGEAVGLFSGGTGSVPGLSNFFSGGLPGMGGGGDGPSSLSSYATNFGAASGAAAVGAGFGTGGMVARPAGASGGGGTGSVGSAGSIGNRYSLGAVKPWVAKAAGLIGPKFGVKTILGVGARGNVSDHPKGLALDFMCSKSTGDSLSAFAVANHKALNITYVIWRQRIWSINHPGWRAMEDRGSPTANHMDHVHVSFLASPTNGDFSGLGGGSVGGGKGSGLGSTPTASMGMASSSPNNGFSAAGGFSESAALGLGGGGYGVGGGVGGMGGGMGSGGAGGGGYGGGGTGGIKGNYGSAGGPGSLRIGSFNALFTNNSARTAADFKKISGKADVIGWQEMHGKHASDFAGWMKKNTNWTYYGAGRGDTAVSWNNDKYRALQKGSFDILDRMDSKTGVRNIPSASAYVLLQDKATGSKFWAVSNHLQAHATTRGGAWAATQKTQLQQLAGLYSRLRKTGIPVVNVGDWNNSNPNLLKGSQFGNGIDQIFAQGASVSGGGTIGAGQTNSDHAFVWANVNLPGGKSVGKGGSVAQNIALGQQMAASRGWTGAQWAALRTLWMHESGWRTNADNPTSSAYGIPQALTELHHLGDKYKSDPKTQIAVGAQLHLRSLRDPRPGVEVLAAEGLLPLGCLEHPAGRGRPAPSGRDGPRRRHSGNGPQRSGGRSSQGQQRRRQHRLPARIPCVQGGGRTMTKNDATTPQTTSYPLWRTMSGSRH